MNRARASVVWAARYGLPGMALRLAARRGDLIARSAVDPAAIAEPSILYDDLYALGPVASNRFVHATAHHAIATQVLRDPAFRVGPAGAGVGFVDRLADAALDRRALGVVDAPSLLAIDAPQHTRIRKLVSQAFTPKVIADYGERIEAIAHDLLDRATTDAFDLVDDYAAQLPLTVIADIMGVPEHTRPALLRIGNDAAQTLDPALALRDYLRAEAAIREGGDLIDEQAASVRAEPGESLFDQLVRANADGDSLSDEELRVNTLLLIGAGFETTVNLIGNAVALLLRHPEQLARLRDEPAGWGTAVDEVLRYESPVQITVRGVGSTTTLAGVPLREGRPFLVMIGAANRDPEVFADPHRFDTTRTEARQHLAFSSGAHFCVGAQLARLEASVALRVLFERHPSLALAAPGTRRRTRVLRGWEHLPVDTRLRAGPPPATMAR